MAQNELSTGCLGLSKLCSPLELSAPNRAISKGPNWVHAYGALRHSVLRKGSEKVLGRVLGKGPQQGSGKGVCYGFYCRKGF